MLPSAYLLLINSTEQLQLEDTLVILNNVGFGYSLFGKSSDAGSQTLWIILKPKKDIVDRIASFDQIRSKKSVTLAPLSKPIINTEIISIRQLFRELEWDATAVSDEELSQYFSSLMEGGTRYYIDHDHTGKNWSIAIKPIESHPHYAEAWAKKRIDIDAISESKIFSVEDFKVTKHSFTEEIEDPFKEEPPPL